MSQALQALSGDLATAVVGTQPVFLDFFYMGVSEIFLFTKSEEMTLPRFGVFHLGTCSSQQHFFVGAAHLSGDTCTRQRRPRPCGGHSEVPAPVGSGGQVAWVHECSQAPWPVVSGMFLQLRPLRRTWRPLGCALSVRSALAGVLGGQQWCLVLTGKPATSVSDCHSPGHCRHPQVQPRDRLPDRQGRQEVQAGGARRG